VADAPKVGRTIWNRNKQDICKHLRQIASDADTLRQAPNTARSKTLAISSTAAMAITAFMEMVVIAELESKHLRKRIEELERNGGEQ